MRYRVLIQVGVDPTSGNGTDARRLDIATLSGTGHLEELMSKALDLAEVRGIERKIHRMADDSIFLVEWEGVFDEDESKKEV